MAFKHTVSSGETLNTISQKYGFSNYKNAGITSVPSGNFDLIKPGEEITIPNYNPNEIKTFQQGSPIVSSKDNEGQYRDDSAKLDSIYSSMASAISDKNTVTTKEKTDQIITPPILDKDGKQNGESREIKTTGEVKTDAYLKYIGAKQVEADEANKKAELNRLERENLFKTSLANIDATTNDTLNRINQTFDQQLIQQKRINQLNIDRVKAYGLSSGGQYTPIMFRDAISEREQEASSKVAELDNKRNLLLSEAKSARDQGSSKLLSEKLDSLEKIDTDIRTTLSNIEKEVRTQYDLYQKVVKEDEIAFKKEVETSRNRLKAIASVYVGEYEKDKDTFIQNLIKNPTVKLSYADIVEIMENTIAKASSAKLDLRKKEADIASAEALATQRGASAAKSFADAAIADTEKKNKLSMQNDIPENIKTKEGGDKSRTAFVKKYGIEGGKYWDAVFDKDEYGGYSYTRNAGGAGDKNSEDLRKRADAGGLDYDALKAKYSDEEIATALEENGL